MKNKENNRIIYHELDNPLPPDELKERVKQVREQIEEDNKLQPKELIEEMAQYLKDYLYLLTNNSIENCRILASALINQGWIKLPKDKVMLSIDDWINFNKDHANELIKTSEEEYSLGYIKGSQETAEKIIHYIDTEIRNYISDGDLEAFEKQDINWLKKQFSIEIKE